MDCHGCSDATLLLHGIKFLYRKLDALIGPLTGFFELQSDIRVTDK